jgi:hypothetical protein
MNGMETQLNLRADRAGQFYGQSAHFSGDGFSDMHFAVQALPGVGFAQWVKAAQASQSILEDRSYADLVRQHRPIAHSTMRAPQGTLFDAVVAQHIAPAPGPQAGPRSHAQSAPSSSGRRTMLGKLDWSAIPFAQPIPLFAAGLVMLALLGAAIWVTRRGLWPYLWREWITSVDHKRIGIMYSMLALLMLLRGFIDAIMMRSQQSIAVHGAKGYLPPEHYDQIFSAHGTIMIFFGAMPFIIGLMNFVVPLQLGVRDVAFPTLNSVSFWLTASGALLVNMSLVVGSLPGPAGYPTPP